MASEHPLDTELMDFVAAGGDPPQSRITDHLRRCSLCRLKLSRLIAAEEAGREQPYVGPLT